MSNWRLRNISLLRWRACRRTLRRAVAIASDAIYALYSCSNPLAAAMTTHYRLERSRPSPSNLKLTLPERILIHCICISARSLSAPHCKNYPSLTSPLSPRSSTLKALEAPTFRRSLGLYNALQSPWFASPSTYRRHDAQ